MKKTVKNEKPLLFSDPMVQAILDGRKHKTRRVINHILGLGKITEFFPSTTPGYDWTARCKRGGLLHDLTHEDLLRRCPYGQVGGRLWGREAFADVPVPQGRGEYLPMREDGKIIVYRADSGGGDSSPFLACDGCVRWIRRTGKWTPSIFMPRWASRLDLEITEVCVQPLQEISEEDAIAEGIYLLECEGGGYKSARGGQEFDTAVEAFYDLWNSINGPGSWGQNPYVWPISFRRIKP